MMPATRLPFPYLHQAIFAMLLVWLFLVFAGYDSIPLTNDSYNAWRFGQIGLLIVFSLGFLTLPSPLFNQAPHLVKIATTIILCFLLLFIVGLKNTTSYLTLSLYTLLTIGTCYIVALFKADRQLFEKLLACSVFAPIPSIIYFIISLIIQFLDPVDGKISGHNTFDNIRYFNDALLPILLILWMRPSFLARVKYNSTVNTLGIAYAFIFFNDGARAIMLSLFLAFIAILAFDRDRKKEIIQPLMHFVVAGIIFTLLAYLDFNVDLNSNNSITRGASTSAGRLEIYIFSFQAFVSDPLSGFGAGNFIGPDPLAHPHNLIFLWLTELGAIGIIFTLILSYLLLKLFLIRKSLPTWSWLSVFILLSNGMMSGSLVYPISQTLTIIIIAYVISQSSPQAALLKPEKNYWIVTCKLFTIATLPLLVITTYWTYPYVKEEILRVEKNSSDSQLLYRSNGPSTWQNNPIIDFPKNGK